MSGGLLRRGKVKGLRFLGLIEDLCIWVALCLDGKVVLMIPITS